MAKEIERKFLLTEGASIPIPAVYKNFIIKQGYVSSDIDHQVRIRLTKEAVIAIKFEGHLIRDEFEYVIPIEDGKEIYLKCDNKLEKKRLSFKKNKYHYDIDTYPNGLVVLEVEFDNIIDMNLWVKPDWIGEEVSGKSEYSNIVLAKQNLKF